LLLLGNFWCCREELFFPSAAAMVLHSSES
jgi:hypothetical protein